MKGFEKPKTKNNYLSHKQAYSPASAALPVPATPGHKTTGCYTLFG